MDFIITFFDKKYTISNEKLIYCKFFYDYVKEKNSYQMTIDHINFNENVFNIILKYIDLKSADKYESEKVKILSEKIKIETIFNMIMAADYLKIKDLYNDYRSYLINKLEKCKSADDFREEFNIEAILSEHEKYEIINENVWNQKILNLSEIGNEKQSNMLFSVYHDNKNSLDIISSTPPNDISNFVKKRKVVNPVKDEAVKSCYTCETEFTLTNRRHHCRACQRIFCSACSSKSIDLQEENNNNYNLSDNVTYNKEVRVCDTCYKEINDQKTYGSIINVFKTIGFQIDHLKKLSSITHTWRQASIWCLSNLRELQYRLPTKDFDKYEKRALWNNKKYWVGHSQWLFQLCRITNREDKQVRESIFELLKKEKNMIVIKQCVVDYVKVLLKCKIVYIS